MPRLIWSQPELLDVQRLYRFVKPKNPDAAQRAMRAIRQGVKALAQQPGIGRPIADMPEEFREWIIDSGDSGYGAAIASSRMPSRSWQCDTRKRLATDRALTCSPRRYCSNSS